MGDDGDANDPGRYSGIVGISSNTCCPTALLRRLVGSVAFITPCTLASCTTRSISLISPLGVSGGRRLDPLPSQIHPTPLPAII